MYRSEVFLQTVLPVSVLALGMVITLQLTFLIHFLFRMSFLWLKGTMS